MGQGESPPLKRAAVRDMAAVPLEVFYCPSRRPADAYPFVHPKPFVNIDLPTVLARSDYAANAGDQEPGLYGPGPDSLAEGDDPSYSWPNDKFTGMVYRRSRLRIGDARDGASHTYLVAESYLNQDDYFSGEATNDDQGMYAGADRDTLRVGHIAYPPLPDMPGVQSDHSFGSAHPSGFHAAFCDGSARLIPYTIDAETHRRLANRKDRQPIDAGQF
jgi:hypothetical protein